MRALVLLLFLIAPPCVSCDDLPAPSSAGKTIAGAGATFNVVKTFVGALQDQLRQFPYPPVIALVALVFGLVLLFNGLKSFEYTVTFACAISFGIVARAAASAHFDGQQDANTVVNVIGLEAALLVGAIAHIGHKGIMVVLGALVGFFVAHLICDFAVINFHLEILLQVEIQVIWYSVCSLLGSCWMYHDKHEKILAFLSPIPGGIFTASALLYFATEAFVAFGCHHRDVKHIWQSEDAECPNNLTPKVAPWIDFFLLGFSKMHSETGAEDVGIFYNTTFNMKKGQWSAGNQQSQGYAILYDHLLTMVLWFVLTVLGIKIQRCVSKRRHAQADAHNKALQKARENAEMKTEKKMQEAKEDAAKQPPKQAIAKPETDNKAPAPTVSKSKWPFGGKKENKVSQLEQGLIDNAKGA